jgi:anthranilate 1,2-dioxygenase small subunit
VIVPGYEQQTVDPRLAREARWDVEEFHTAYCQLLDLGNIERWLEFFTDDCLYMITARENAEADLPVGLVYCEGRDMIRDRAFAVRHTQMFAPRYLQHFVTNVLVLAVKGDEVRAQSNYQLLQTLVEGPTTLLQAGRYYDTFRREKGRLLIKERRCIYDTTLIANDLVLPV